MGEVGGWWGWMDGPQRYMVGYWVWGGAGSGDGFITVPETSGIGPDVDWAALEKAAIAIV